MRLRIILIYKVGKFSPTIGGQRSVAASLTVPGSRLGPLSHVGEYRTFAESKPPAGKRALVRSSLWRLPGCRGSVRVRLRSTDDRITAKG